ncbi:MAG: transporter, family, bicyclomycin/chloramphenicol resistance protein [Hyphomicrobiales bacterium]|nr:transporter, family, bicyclomycin/chloramphenicol resistance protein [Hyphomicrobiales bacterium]
MLLKPDSRGMTVLLAFMTAMGPISTDLYVPALPQLAADLATSPARVQWTLSSYLMGYAFGQLFYGPLSDKYGRKPLLMIGFSAYLLASFASALAGTIEMLTLARFVQGIGGAGPIIVSRAIVRDMYEGARAGRQLSLMSTIMGVAPIVSPVLGGFLAVYFGWRAGFVVMFAVVGAIAFMALLALPETLRQKQQGAISVRSVFGSFAIVARHRTWRVYASLQALGHTGLFTFVAASPFILQREYQLTPVQFGAGFSACSIAFVSGAWTGSRMVGRRGISGVVSIGVGCLALAGVLQTLGHVAFPQYALALFAPELLYFFGIGLVLPHSIAGGLSPFPERAGAASSLQGFLQMTFSALVGMLVVALLDGSAMPLALTTLLMGVGTLAIFHMSDVGKNRRFSGRL